MTDYISRGAAVEIAMRYCPDDDGSCSEAGTDLREMLDELENLPAADVREEKWISVKEHMPDKCGMYYVTGGGRVWLCELFAFGETKGWINNALNPTIEAWFPIPKPPREEQT